MELIDRIMKAHGSYLHFSGQYEWCSCTLIYNSEKRSIGHAPFSDIASWVSRWISEVDEKTAALIVDNEIEKWKSVWSLSDPKTLLYYRMIDGDIHFLVQDKDAKTFYSDTISRSELGRFVVSAEIEK